MAFPSRVLVTDMGMREGFRAESLPLSLDAKVRVGEGLIAAGIRHLGATAFPVPHAAPRRRPA